jgi:hypothetical protein
VLPAPVPPAPVFPAPPVLGCNFAPGPVLLAVAACLALALPLQTGPSAIAGAFPAALRSTLVEAPAPAPSAPPPAPAMPRGKGMWLHYLRQASGGDPAAVVAQAKAVGLSHIYLRLGSSRTGFYAQGDLDRMLPVAHAGGLAVVGWDFVYLDDPVVDAERAAAEIAYTTPDGHRVDAFTADIESPHEGVRMTPHGVDAYGARLRQLVGPGYPLMAAVPRPASRVSYPYAETARHFDAFAPMVYWMNRDPAVEVSRAAADLAPLGKPILPVGQAYDGAIDGGPPGAPSRQALDSFIATASASGAVGVSFWVWHHATPDHWSAIASAP